MRRPGAPRDEVTLRPDEYRLVRELFAERFGIQLGPEARASVERRLRERLAVRGHASFLEYYQFLKWNPAGAEELDEAVEVGRGLGARGDHGRRRGLLGARAPRGERERERGERDDPRDEAGLHLDSFVALGGGATAGGKPLNWRQSS